MPPQKSKANNNTIVPWAIVPAAGHGQRMLNEVPKQYLPINGVAMLQRSVDALLNAIPDIQCVAVLSADDSGWSTIPASKHPQTVVVEGGDTRAESVVAGLNYIVSKDSSDPWVLVHDAARPLLSADDVSRLVEAVVSDDEVGGILGVPVQDTLKRSNGAQVAAIDHTVERIGMWQAQTPQLFRAQQLLDAIRVASDGNISITDEASAMEYIGEHPVLVEALHPNFKVTRETDRLLASALLENAATDSVPDGSSR